MHDNVVLEYYIHVPSPVAVGLATDFTRRCSKASVMRRRMMMISSEVNLRSSPDVPVRSNELVYLLHTPGSVATKAITENDDELLLGQDGFASYGK